MARHNLDQFDLWFGSSSTRLDEPVKWSDGDIERLRDALLVRSLQDAAQTREQQAHDDAVAWLTNDDPLEPLGFIACCRALNVDPYRLRESFERMILRPNGTPRKDHKKTDAA